MSAKKNFSGWVKEIKDTLTRASKGQWWIDSHGSALHVPSECDVLVVFKAESKAVRHKDTGNLSSWRNDNDADYIPAACPDNVDELLKRYEALNALALKLVGKSEDGEYKFTFSDVTYNLVVTDGHVAIDTIDPAV